MSLRKAFVKSVLTVSITVAGWAKSRRVWGTGIALAGVIVMGGALYSQPSVAEGLTRATSRQPERYSELYFNLPQLLPHIVPPRRTATFGYGISNHEATTSTYHVRVSQVTDGHVRVIAQPSFVLSDGQSLSALQSFTPAGTGHSYEFIVELVDQGQSIHFRSQS